MDIHHVCSNPTYTLSNVIPYHCAALSNFPLCLTYYMGVIFGITYHCAALANFPPCSHILEWYHFWHHIPLCCALKLSTVSQIEGYHFWHHVPLCRARKLLLCVTHSSFVIIQTMVSKILWRHDHAPFIPYCIMHLKEKQFYTIKKLESIRFTPTYWTLSMSQN